MTTSPDPLGVLRHSHDALRAMAEPLGLDQLRQGSYDKEWSIAQVLAHMGSQAEISGLFLDAALSGQDPPGREAFAPIWERWNGKDPQRQFILETGDGVSLTAAPAGPPEPGLPEVNLPAEAFVRLVYGRLDPAHTPPSVKCTGVDLDDLRPLFPGF
ncbi:MAG: maleylpyruvate isomerase N-terminal domain-containing protein [Streptosporangiaceae bacterium]|nr:maleylpyruvate isomerase N-terminal domain-containing protein [Streptosporangiaceae bacterium]